MTRSLSRFLRSESGSTTAEYALLLAVLAAAVVAAVVAFRPAAGRQFGSTGAAVGTYGVPDED